MVMVSLSARMTTLNQMFDWSPNNASPITAAVGAMNHSEVAKRGCLFLRVYIGIDVGLRRSSTRARGRASTRVRCRRPFTSTMTPSQSLFIDVRGVRYHVRAWGPEHAPAIVFLHGWMDVSASFQFVVDAFKEE